MYHILERTDEQHEQNYNKLESCCCELWALHLVLVL